MVLVAPALAKRSVGQGGGDVKLLPYHRFEIHSPMKRTDALAAMTAHVEPEKWFRFFGWPNAANDTRFEGVVNSDGFIVRRVMGYRNSFAPVVSADVQSVGGLTRIVVTMRPMIFVLVFGAVWCAFALSAMFAAEHSSGVWMGALLIAIFYLGTMGGFWYEANKQEATLKQIFKAS